MIDAPDNRVSIRRIEEDPDAGAVLCEIEIATARVQTRGFHWLLSEDIETFNEKIDELKEKRAITLNVEGDYEGAFEVTLSPFNSSGTYKVNVACRFTLDHPLHGDYGVQDSFIIEGEFVNRSLNRI